MSLESSPTFSVSGNRKRGNRALAWQIEKEILKNRHESCIYSHMASFISKNSGFSGGKGNEFGEYIVVSLPQVWMWKSEIYSHRVWRSPFGCGKLVNVVRGCGRN